MWNELLRKKVSTEESSSHNLQTTSPAQSCFHADGCLTMKISQSDHRKLESKGDWWGSSVDKSRSESHVSPFPRATIEPRSRWKLSSFSLEDSFVKWGEKRLVCIIPRPNTRLDGQISIYSGKLPLRLQLHPCGLPRAEIGAAPLFSLRVEGGRCGGGFPGRRAVHTVRHN